MTWAHTHRMMMKQVHTLHLNVVCVYFQHWMLVISGLPGRPADRPLLASLSLPSAFQISTFSTLSNKGAVCCCSWGFTMSLQPIMACLRLCLSTNSFASLFCNGSPILWNCIHQFHPTLIVGSHSWQSFKKHYKSELLAKYEVI